MPRTHDVPSKAGSETKERAPKKRKRSMTFTEAVSAPEETFKEFIEPTRARYAARATKDTKTSPTKDEAAAVVVERPLLPTGRASARPSTAVARTAGRTAAGPVKQAVETSPALEKPAGLERYKLPKGYDEVAKLQCEIPISDDHVGLMTWEQFLDDIEKPDARPPDTACTMISRMLEALKDCDKPFWRGMTAPMLAPIRAIYRKVELLASARAPSLEAAKALVEALLEHDIDCRPPEPISYSRHTGRATLWPMYMAHVESCILKKAEMRRAFRGSNI